MQMKKDYRSNHVISCENYLPDTSYEKIEQFIKLALKLNISVLVFENLDIVKRDKLIKEFHDRYPLISPTTLFHHYDTIDEATLIRNFIQYIRNNNQILIATRKTITDTNINKVKHFLAKNRFKFDLIAVRANSEKLLKWSIHDRRIDFVTVEDISKSQIIDKGVCSLLKEFNKPLEITFSPVLEGKNLKEISYHLRERKKLANLLLEKKVELILSSNPSNIFLLRTADQLRYLGSLISIPFTLSKSYVLENQLRIIVKNVIKLDERYIFEGIKEVE